MTTVDIDLDEVLTLASKGDAPAAVLEASKYVRLGSLRPDTGLRSSDLLGWLESTEASCRRWSQREYSSNFWLRRATQALALVLVIRIMEHREQALRYELSRVVEELRNMLKGGAR